MLPKKYWLETRSRFVLGLISIGAVCLFFVFAQPWILRQWALDEAKEPHIYNPPWLLIAREDYVYFIWHFLYDYLLQFTWAVFTMMLAFGGLSHETEKGTALFTLSLPVRRKKLFILRAGVGYLEVICLAILPALLIPLSSQAIGLIYNWQIAANHSLLFVIGGLVFYSIGIFINSMVKSEAVCFFLGIAVVILIYFLFQPFSESEKMPLFLRMIDLPGFIAGKADGSIASPEKLPGILSCIGVSALLLLVSFRITKRIDF